MDNEVLRLRAALTALAGSPADMWAFIQLHHIPRVPTFMDEHAATPNSWRVSIAQWALGRVNPS